MAQRSSTEDSDPVINVIEQDVPGVRSAEAPSGGNGRDAAFDSAAMEAVSARRRREFDAARARMRDHAIRDDVSVPLHAKVRAVADMPLPDTGADQMPLDLPPERVRKRYLRAGNQYFLKEAPYQLAFEDLGASLVTEHNRPDVVESMVDMARAKSWRRVRVSGHEAFRSEVWLQGTLLGIKVSGYEPMTADLARLADARQVRLNNRIVSGPEIEPKTAAGFTAHADEHHVESSLVLPQERTCTASEDASPAGPVRKESSTPPNFTKNRNATIDEPDAPRRYAGELREHGRAPFQHNPARSASYYAVFRDAAGDDHVLWGVDLERAVFEAQAAVGQEVTLENLGRRLVTVAVPVLDDNGAVVAREEKDVFRNTWQVDVVQRRRQSSQTTSRTKTPPNDAVQSRADLRESSTAEPLSQRHLGMQMANEERALHLAVLAAAMREQGFSERSISRVQQRATRVLDAFREEDIPVPRPKVFDVKAPSGRDRRMPPMAERSPAREIECAPAGPSMPPR
jgi:hypothetical protein